MGRQSRAGPEILQRRPDSGKANGVKPEPALAQQYGGRHSGGWVSSLPKSWIPFVQLARLSPPVALALIYFPHLFGLLLAAIIRDSTPSQVLRTGLILLPWSLFFSNAAHAWNDIVDAPLDAAVERTRERPIPRGAVSVRAALIFGSSQMLLGVCVLYFGFSGQDGDGVALYVLPNALATLYYPYAKRHTYFSQIILGFCLAWGAVIGSAAMGHEPFAVKLSLSLSPSQDQFSPLSMRFSTPVVSLVLSCVLWTAIYDTIYAHQDVADDKRLGLRSLAVLLGDRGTKPGLSLLLCTMVVTLWTCGISSGKMGWWPYMVIAPCGCAVSLGCMIAYVDIRDSTSCWWWFRYGFWTAGGSMAAALVAEYIVHHLSLQSW